MKIFLEYLFQGEIIMNKKMKIIILIAIFIVFIIIWSIVVKLVKDFGIDSLGKSIVALCNLKTNKDIDYVEINEDIYMVKNKNIRKNIIFTDTKDRENIEEQIIENATFEIYKDNILYSFVRVENGI